ncbi:hypothetical protein [Rhodoplanes sp. Z2-YC6860]|uniref:hypothetical protein n=1 Tax=Rhodoplanes sp. Z2-YC6860 TaxID=674703 RepID=UPI0012ED2D78|nr:hypothetical protein [Rhodoplanes sp. Z2-YC6860]
MAIVPAAMPNRPELRVQGHPQRLLGLDSISAVILSGEQAVPTARFIQRPERDCAPRR